MKFHEKKHQKTWNSLKIVEVVQAVLNTAQNSKNLVFVILGSKKIEKVDPKPHPHPILGASRGVTTLQ